MNFFQRRIIGDNERVKRFRIMLSVFFLGLVIPLALVIYHGLEQFENEMEFQYQVKSVNILKQLNKKLNTRVKIERKRSINHYNFYQWVTNPLTGKDTKEISPLANPNSYPDNLGLIGYFQINADKSLSTPLLPYQTRKQIAQANTNLKWQEIERRIAIKEKIKGILLRNDFVIKAYDENTAEQLTVNENSNDSDQIKKESFQVKITDNDELIIFRNFWIAQEHYIQGFVVDQKAYLQDFLSDHFIQGHFENDVQLRLKVIHSNIGIHKYFQYSIDEQGKASVEQVKDANTQLEQKYIYHGYLIAPFQKLQLKFTTDNYPLGKASGFVVFFLVVLIVVIISGCLVFYWLGIKQIELAEQRMNFVSSVSHELRTPLTSILMYAEMLKSGMVSDPIAQLEYHNFIFTESSRLSRLISNILKLSSLNKEQEMINLESVNVMSLQDTIQSKISSLIEKNEFTVNYQIDERITNETMALVDLDAFTQIVINLVDNAVKFFNAAKIEDNKRRQIDIGFSLVRKSSNQLCFSVRDYGPGISNSEQDKIFELFYREGNEMTRTTPGTGIGLALVNELVLAQGGQISVKKVEPGVEFQLIFSSRQND